VAALAGELAVIAGKELPALVALQGPTATA
jgi:hypothetical protein